VLVTGYQAAIAQNPASLSSCFTPPTFSLQIVCK
jgi:hypothetical protein